jgi:hypothetical protein
MRFLQRALEPTDGVANMIGGFSLTQITQSIQRPTEIIDAFSGFFRADCDTLAHWCKTPGKELSSF